MFTSKVRELMNKKNKTIMQIAEETGLSTRTIHRSTQDSTIGACQLNTLGRIGEALGVKTKRLYDETAGRREDDPE